MVLYIYIYLACEHPSVSHLAGRLFPSPWGGLARNIKLVVREMGGGEGKDRHRSSRPVPHVEPLGCGNFFFSNSVGIVHVLSLWVYKCVCVCVCVWRTPFY